MKIVLVAINTKYIHSNLAVYSLKAYAKQHLQDADIDIAEYTINQYTDQIMRDIYLKKPDVVAFSCYIWNRKYICELIPELHKILPNMQIWAGGPEASYDAEHLLLELPELNGVMYGEGEKVFLNLSDYLIKKNQSNMEEQNLKNINGIVFRMENGEIHRNPPEAIMDMSEIPFVYKDMENFANKIIYYESSRGCPFSCSYCLSSIDKQLRFRDIELVKKELKFFLDNNVRQVKFVDRTFNCKKSHAMAIWQYIKDNDNGITNFHFEISADLIDDEQIKLLKQFRPGLAQFEIGVQSTNAKTIKEINRTMNLERLKKVVDDINEGQNIHQHLDLIAGLPYEDYDSFVNSFNDVYRMRPEQLQLGFLKVLSGSLMHGKAEEYGVCYQSQPPYEVLFTKWIKFNEIIKLKNIEEVVEVYYNSGQFSNTMRYLEKQYDTPFEMFEAIEMYYEERKLFEIKHSRMARYEILYRFLNDNDEISSKVIANILLYDLYLRENIKSRPEFFRKPFGDKDVLRELYNDYKDAGNLVHIEAFQINPMSETIQIDGNETVYILFDYRKRNPLSNNAFTKILSIR